MIHFKDNILDQISILSGNPDTFSCGPYPAWHNERLNFLAELSRYLLKKSNIRDFPDVMTFAYWCRKANLQKMFKKEMDPDVIRYGLGLTFHIAPSNVPINFAFSLVFGILSGNSSIIRVSSKVTPSRDYLIQAFQEILSLETFAQISRSILIVEYERSDEVNAFFLKHAKARIIWGGNETIKYMRNFKVPYRSREVVFSDRYSLSILDAPSVSQADDVAFKKLLEGIYNDIYLMDQFACSSPQLVLWNGKDSEVKQAQKRLWPALSKFASEKYAINPIQVMDKYVDICRKLSDFNNIKQFTRFSGALYVITIDALQKEQHKMRGHSGTVIQYHLNAIEELTKIVNDSYQTLTYYGLSKEYFSSILTIAGLEGIDRIVPVGRAVEMDIWWDGYDIVPSLSRRIDIQ